MRRAKTIRKRFLVHEYEFKVCPKCKGSKNEMMKSLSYPSGDYCVFEMTCQFCHGQGECSQIVAMVDCYKTRSEYVPIGEKKK